MFDSLFPGWSDPSALVLLLGVRFAVNASLTWLVGRVVGLLNPFTVVLAAGTAVSTVLAVLVLRPGGFGLDGSYVEFGVQLLVLVVVGGVALASYRFSLLERLGIGLGVLCGLGLQLWMIPIYGEAFVAP
jgi:hypothetical protein